MEINETGLNMKTAKLQTSSTGNNTEDTVAGGTNKEVYSPTLNVNATLFMPKLTSILPRKSVKEWPTSISVTDVRSFLGTASYYKRFIKDFASIASPLYQLTEKHTRFYWTEECQSAFDILKEALCNAPNLVFPISPMVNWY